MDAVVVTRRMRSDIVEQRPSPPTAETKNRGLVTRAGGAQEAVRAARAAPRKVNILPPIRDSTGRQPPGLEMKEEEKKGIRQGQGKERGIGRGTGAEKKRRGREEERKGREKGRGEGEWRGEGRGVKELGRRVPRPPFRGWQRREAARLFAWSGFFVAARRTAGERNREKTAGGRSWVSRRPDHGLRARST